MDPRTSALLPPDTPVAGIRYDSRAVTPGDLFVCLRGGVQDGHDHASAAARRGACVIVGERESVSGAGPYVQVRDSRAALALLSCAFHGHPSRALSLCGVTGTNGKTSVTWMIDAVYRAAGLPSAVLGTLGSGSVPGSMPALRPFVPAARTTPEAPDLQQELAAWRDAGIRAGAMEVSSHGLALRRSYGTRFACVVFTNLSVDHLDFHGSLPEYFSAKARLFRSRERGPEEAPACAVVNAEDPAGARLREGSDDAFVFYGLTQPAQVRAGAVSLSPEGIRFLLSADLPSGLPSLPRGRRGSWELVSPLLGSFQVSNLLAAAATGLVLGLDPEAVAAGLGNLHGIPGRMERVDRGQGFPLVVDYAHTPDALSRALSSLRPFTSGRLLVVFGCGGDRDAGKRPLMGEAAGKLADRVILTDDNPRSEDPAEIRRQIRQGCEPTGVALREIGDRAEAIRAAVREARAGDVILLAGKGHETVQVRGPEQIPFDDRLVAAGILEERMRGEV